MNRIFLDTYALLELANGTDSGRAVLARVKQGKAVLVSPLNLYELWYIAAQRGGDQAADAAVFWVKSLAEAHPVSEEVCILAAKLRKRHSGKKIGAVDFITAASAIISGAVILTGDKHFLEITEAKAEII